MVICHCESRNDTYFVTLFVFHAVCLDLLSWAREGSSRTCNVSRLGDKKNRKRRTTVVPRPVWYSGRSEPRYGKRDGKAVEGYSFVDRPIDVTYQPKELDKLVMTYH